MTTQRRPQRGRLQTNLLKVILCGGAIVSTLLGGRLLAQQDAAPIINVAPGQQLIIPEQRNSPAVNISDAPIPEVVMPRPVTRSRSSR